MATQHLDLEEQEQLEQLKAFWKRWGNLITWAITLALMAFAGWQAWNWHQRDQAAQASAMYDAFDTALAAQDLAKASQAALEMRSRFASTAYTTQANLQVAKLQLEKGQADAARASLAWVAEQGFEASYRDLARLRLAGLQMDAKAYDEAAKTLAAIKSTDFMALLADRQGDLLQLQGKPEQAKAEYQKALAALAPGQEYRQVVQVKLATLGVPVDVHAQEGAQ